jgi:hypothetical protein
VDSPVKTFRSTSVKPFNHTSETLPGLEAPLVPASSDEDSSSDKLKEAQPDLDENSSDFQPEIEPIKAKQKPHRGRPRGSKNKPKAVAESLAQLTMYLQEDLDNQLNDLIFLQSTEHL